MPAWPRSGVPANPTIQRGPAVLGQNIRILNNLTNQYHGTGTLQPCAPPARRHAQGDDGSQGRVCGPPRRARRCGAHAVDGGGAGHGGRARGARGDAGGCGGGGDCGGSGGRRGVGGGRRGAGGSDAGRDGQAGRHGRRQDGAAFVARGSGRAWARGAGGCGCFGSVGRCRMLLSIAHTLSLSLFLSLQRRSFRTRTGRGTCSSSSGRCG